MSTPMPGQPNPYAPPKATVEDIADDTTAGEPAGRGTRLLAVTVDGLIFGAAVEAPALIGAMRHATNFMPSLSDFYGPGSGIALLGLIVWLAVTLRFMHQSGQSIAKRLLGIKVVRKDGSRASLARLFWLRNIVSIVPGVIPMVGSLYGLVDALMIFGEPRQCLHDKIADTMVVKA
jgi:uncharacterized RDD family membrane protein YckC